MRWSDEGVVLAARRHGESALIVQMLTAEHGRHAGIVRGGQAPQRRALYQIGNRLRLTWMARLTEHLGGVTGELLRGYPAHFIGDPPRLACLAAAAAMAEATLPEREPHPRVYEEFVALLEALEANERWAAGYVRWELTLLAELGFGLDLSRCAATGATADLVYVSPKSGRAVSAAAAAAYALRLLPLPGFLLPGSMEDASSGDVVVGLMLTGYFLGRRVFPPHRQEPQARSRFFDILATARESQSR